MIGIPTMGRLGWVSAALLAETLALSALNLMCPLLESWIGAGSIGEGASGKPEGSTEMQ